MKYDFEVYKKNHLEYHVVVIGATRIPFYISKSGILYDYCADPKHYKKIFKDDCPNWLSEKIQLLLKSEQCAEIKFEYFDGEFWKTGVEEFWFNFIKNDENFHELAEKVFLDKFSGKYNQIKIVSVHMA